MVCTQRKLPIGSSKVEFSLLQGRYSREEIKKWKEVFAAAVSLLFHFTG